MAYIRKNNRPGLTPELIRAEYAKGNGPKEVGDKYGCSRQAVSDMARRHNIFFDAARRTVHDNMPWDVPKEFRNQSAYRYLLAHTRYVEVGPDELTKVQLSRVRSFHRRVLQGDVLEFNPNTGFEWKHRKPSDNNLCIRLNEYSKPLTPEGEFIWARPVDVP